MQDAGCRMQGKEYEFIFIVFTEVLCNLQLAPCNLLLVKVFFKVFISLC
jgi:hypothetical protein